jgi:alpha-galactosidase
MWKREIRLSRLLALLILGALCGTSGRVTAQSAGTLAATPPLGWNSWDAFGTTINEAQFKANADWFAKHLKTYGWEYVVIDMEWFVSNPTAEGGAKTAQFAMDSYGRYIPPANRFPSAESGAGFKPLADYVHARGLKFGIHILRGVPKEAVKKNLPIEDSKFHTAEAAITSDTCPWNGDSYGVADNAAGQAYYDSIARLYASWGVDFVKVDCISSHPYKGDEIRMLSAALAKTNRPIVLSLSPGPAPMDKADEMRKYAQMWRISEDVWDIWRGKVAEFPQGVGDQFATAAKWAALTEPGHWPDADMLPIGRLGPAPGWGQPRSTRLTHNEQRTLLTLWSMFRSPLMVGGSLPDADDWTTSLLTNPEVIAVDQHSADGRQVLATDTTVVWLSRPESRDGYYLALFNVSPEAHEIQYEWKQLGLISGDYKVRDLWEHKEIGAAKSLDVTLPSHGGVLYGLQPD